MQKQHAFGLLDLIITLLIAGIFASLAIPSFHSLYEKALMTTDLQQITQAIHFARSEAITRGVNVTLCPSLTTQTCDGKWSNGILVFLDSDSRHKPKSDQERLRYFGPFTKNISLTFQAFPTAEYLQISARGYTNQQNGTFSYRLNKRSNNKDHKIVISKSGRVRIESNV